MKVDLRAVGVGGATGLVVAFPGLVLGGLLDNGAFAIIVVAGFVAAGTVAAAKRPDAPLTHGILAAATTAVLADLIAISLRLARGDSLRPELYAFNLVLAAGFGLLGAVLSDRITR